MNSDHTDPLEIKLNCTKIQRDRFLDIFANQELNVYEVIEKYKSKNNIARHSSILNPLIINIDNTTGYDIQRVKIEIQAAIKALKVEDRNESVDKNFLIDYDYTYKIKRGDFYNGLLFDASEFSQIVIKISSVNYMISNGEIGTEFRTNAPLLIDLTDLNNQYHGYRSLEEMQTYIMLKNYVQSSLSSRSLLMKIVVKAIKEIANNRFFEFEGQRFPFRDREIPPIMGTIQLDIVAKIMIYIEDLMTLLISMRDYNGNYYQLLDRTQKQTLDLGDRINEFLKNIDNITFDQWRIMPSYINPDHFKPENPAVEKLIRLNIEEFKKVFDYVRVFKDTHNQIFRRYKHAGLPFRPGYFFQNPLPLTSRRFDSYSIISIGANPLVDVIPLPFSDDIIESYGILTAGLEDRIGDIVQNRIECIRRGINGIIPLQNYSVSGTFSSEEDNEIVAAINEHYIQNPIRAFDDVYNFQITVDMAKNMKWYVDLDDNMKKWRKLNESNDRSG